MRQLLILLMAAAALPAIASDPGEPLDCSDWVFLEPGLSCAVRLADCNVTVVGSGQVWCSLFVSAPHVAHDNYGQLHVLVSEALPQQGGCQNLERYSLVRSDAGSATVVAYIEDRCVNPGGRWDNVTVSGQLLFDEQAGEFVMFYETSCVGCTAENEYPSTNQLLGLGGFATTFEILQTYTPTSGPISFRVPYMPEGFPAADWFDSYYGDLATVGDWSQAQPLQCGYPASPPSVGDYLTISDTLPTPDPGQGYYYVTAVNYQGQRRYGRKSSGAVLSGRDPGVLPGCHIVSGVAGIRLTEK